ncbi:hypothetical protein Sjap_005444 [Stephania japonica]|uniref:Endonuclease/exonuclease/phosphatase domain-containing protein n=1 Tax=Stephania japonica TaxID=461633 RepID=A0AAP0PLV2_9MAGN
MGFQGPKFAWTNRRNLDQRIGARLGRALISQTWADLFPSAFVQVLTHAGSDHLPILINCRSEYNRFDKRWLKEDKRNE